MATTRRIAAFWLLYMAGLGLVFPFQALYLKENAALLGAQVGLVLAVRPLMGMLGQPFWGQLADRSGSRTRVLAGLAFANAFAYALMPFAEGFAQLLAAMAFIAIFGTSIIPMATSVSMAALGERASERFGLVRVWGTVGFLLLVVGFPLVLERVQAWAGWEVVPGGPSEPGLGAIFGVAAVLTLAAGCVALGLPSGGALSVRASRGDLAQLLRHGPYRRALAFTFLAWLCLQGPILIFPLYVRAHGGDLETLSRLWIPMLALEIPLVALSGATLRRFGARTLLLVGTAADGFRWFTCSFLTDLHWVYVLQLLHGVVVAGLIVGIALYVEGVVPDRLRSSGQALVAMLGISAAGMLSAALAGWLSDLLGPDAPLRIGGCGALLLGCCVPWLLPRPSRPPEAAASG